MTSLLAGYDALGVLSKQDKLERAKPFVVQGEAGNVNLLAGEWNEKWLAHMHNQPDTPTKDIMDATAGSFNVLTADYIHPTLSSSEPHVAREEDWLESEVEAAMREATPEERERIAAMLVELRNGNGSQPS